MPSKHGNQVWNCVGEVYTFSSPEDAKGAYGLLCGAEAKTEELLSKMRERCWSEYHLVQDSAESIAANLFKLEFPEPHWYRGSLVDRLRLL